MPDSGALADGRTIKLTLTPKQLAQVAKASRRASLEELRIGLNCIGELKAGEVYHNKEISTSLINGLRVLEMFNDGEQHTAREVSKQIGLSNTPTGRYLTTLTAVGLLDRDPVNRLYSLGERLKDRTQDSPMVAA